ESEDFEGSSIPSGWTTVVESGTQDWTFGSGVMPGGADFPTNAAIFDDDAAGSGPANMARLLSPVYDLTGGSNVQLSFDYSLQEFAGSGTFEAEVWDGSAWQQLLFVDVDTAPVNSGDIDVSAYANAAFQVRFTYDDENGGWNWGAGVDN
ncbi:MAG TPA: subtilisin, partial [Aequorivita sp.]|nr:subtilisin [Aequorivita sp.]